MIQILMLLGILGLGLLIILIQSVEKRKRKGINRGALRDEQLQYHLDWRSLQGRMMRLYLPVKKINAARRYRDLAGVSPEEARDVIEYIIGDNEIGSDSVLLKDNPGIEEDNFYPAIEQRIEQPRIDSYRK